MEEHVILVDTNDNEIGIEEKIEAHKSRKLHRAFSIFILNSQNEMLLQQRANNKYHSGGLWTNTCCSHPRQGEEIEQAAHRRLKEEMGFDCNLKKAFHFIYKAELDNGLVENEFDHVFIGNYKGKVNPDPNEVNDYKWVNINSLKVDVNKHPESYTEWFKIAFKKFLQVKNP